MNIFDKFVDGYSVGNQMRQQRETQEKQSALGQLAATAYQSTQDGRQGYVAEAMARDPEFGFKLNESLGKIDNDRESNLVNGAKMILSMPESMRPQAYAKFRQDGAHFGYKLPDQYTPEVEQMAQQIVASTQKASTVQSTQQLANGNLGMVMSDGRVVDSGTPFHQAQKLETHTTPDGNVVRVNVTDGTYTDIMPAGGQGGGQAVPSPQGQTGNYQNGIAKIETHLGKGAYTMLGPVITSGSLKGDRAYGKYQIMGSNIGPWSQAALGRALTPQEFLANPQAQDAVFNHRFGMYVDKYGPEKAARAWLGGEGNINNPNVADQNGTTVASYGQRFMRNIGGAAGTQPTLYADNRGSVGVAGQLRGTPKGALTPYQQMTMQRQAERDAVTDARDARRDARQEQAANDAREAKNIAQQIKNDEATARVNEARQSANDLVSNVDSLLRSPGFKDLGTTGGWAVLKTPDFIKHPAKDAYSQLDTISNQIAISTMARLKSLSAAGATGFGALSEKELGLLQNSISAIKNPSISNSELRKNLLIIRNTVSRMGQPQQGGAASRGNSGGWGIERAD